MVTFDSLWAQLCVELNLTDEDLIMASAVIAYTRGANGGTDVTCTNMITNKPVTMNLPIDATQLLEWECASRPVQVQFPSLTPAQREFLLTGLSEEQWDEMASDYEDLDYEMGKV